MQVKSQFQAFGNHLIKIVSESLKLTFNLLTVLLVIQATWPSRLRLADVIFSEIECVGVKRFLRFFRNDKADLRPFFMV